MQEKKSIIGISFIVLLLMLGCACIQPQPPVSPIPTKPPTATALPTATLPAEVRPTVTGTPVPTETLVPTATNTPTPTDTPIPTATNAPTLTPTPTETAVPIPTPTEMVMPTPSPTPVPSPTPEPTVVPPVPEVNPEALLNHGWQSVMDLTESYQILFPELFTESEIEYADELVVFHYANSKDAGIGFKICFLLEKDFDLLADEIGEEHEMYEMTLDEQQVFRYTGKRGKFLCSGYVLENTYGITSEDGEETEQAGALLIEFTYPIEQCELYETEQYQFYIISIPREE